jgi:RNA polymerase sigma factor (sigma-70 family)
VHTDDDATLLRRTKEGDTGAAAELLRRHLPIVHGLFRNIPCEDADDLTQQTSLACLESVARVRDAASLRPFVVTVARHRLFAYWRAKRKISRTAALDSEYSSLLALTSRDDGEEHARALLEGLQQLPAELRTVLHLAYWQDLPSNRIAAELGVPAGTVASRLRRAKEKLREWLRCSFPTS